MTAALTRSALSLRTMSYTEDLLGQVSFGRAEPVGAARRRPRLKPAPPDPPGRPEASIEAERHGSQQRPGTAGLRSSIYRDALAIVAAEYASDLQLSDVARRVLSSQRQLQRVFSEIGRTTFSEHLTAVRMERAAELLSLRAISIREVSQRVGYRQPAHFAKKFRVYHGLTPSEFRFRRRRMRSSML
jgi:AraC family transcriptional regulator of adaptative response / methylphosphotriester-DNA alkyltransferase methyltransferase